MKPAALGIVLVGACGAVLGAAPAVLAQTCRNSETDCKADPKALSCAVKVAMSDVDGRCTVKSLDNGTTNLERHQVQACVGDVVTWTFDNKCTTDVTIEIGNFRVDEVIIQRHIKERPKIRTEDRDTAAPLSGASSVRVPRGRSANLPKTVTACHAPRTYKYDLIQLSPGGKRVLLDPEIEIYR
jgi:hypothetical protein